jgi:hypothetical protein
VFFHIKLGNFSGFGDIFLFIPPKYPPYVRCRAGISLSYQFFFARATAAAAAARTATALKPMAEPQPLLVGSASEPAGA